MNNKLYLEKIITSEIKKIKQDKYLARLIREEYHNIKESATDIRDTLDDLEYDEKGSEIDNGGPMQSHASSLFVLFFEFLKKELPDVKIKVTGGNDKFHKGMHSRHIYGEAIDFVVSKGNHRDVWKVLQKFKRKHSRDFKCLDEYTNPTEHATGGHFHISYIGSDSVYNKAKENGELPELGPNGAKYKSDGTAIPISQFNSIHHWDGEDSNGTSLSHLDELLYEMSKTSNGGTGGTSMKLVSFSAGGFGDVKEVTSHKWVVTARLMAPIPKDAEAEKEAREQGFPIPDKDGFLPGKPETIVFYPSGDAYLYNQGSSADVETEPSQKWLKRLTNLLKYTPNLYTPFIWYADETKPAGAAGIIGGEVINLYNNSGDLLGTLAVRDDKTIVLDLTDSPQFDVDEFYEVKGGAKWMNRLQTLLDWAGFIPVIGDIIDIINALIYYLRGKYLEAALSCIAIIPIVGSFVKFGVKGAMKAQKQAAKALGRGAMKKVTGLGSLGRAIAKGSAKRLFKSGAAGEKAAYNMIDALINSKPPILTIETLAKVDPSKLKNIFTSKSGKAKKVFKKYVKDADFPQGDLLKAFDAAADNLSLAIAKHQDEALDVVSQFGPKATTGWGAKGFKQNTKKAAKDAAEKAAKEAPASSGLISKVLTGPISWFKKKGSRQIERLRNHFRLPAKRVELIQDWMLKDVTDQLMANPKMLNEFLKSTGVNIPKGFKVSKLSPGQKQKLFKKIVENDKNLIIQQLMSHPDAYFGAQLKYGLASMGTAKGLYQAMRSALGPKTYDIVYNEVSEALWKEGGVDVGSYGDEQQSVITYMMFKMFTDEQSQIARRKRNITLAQEVGAIARMLNIIGIDVNNAMSFVERKQIIDGTLNDLPGDSYERKIAFVKVHGTPSDQDIIIPQLEKMAEEDQND